MPTDKERYRILVVDDEPRMINFIRMNLELESFRVVSAENGLEAVKRCRELLPDCVLLDVMMPEMDGLTATRELRRDPALRDLPVIALTAKAMRDDYEECLAAGCNDYMTKPIDVDKLISLCRVWIAR